MIKKYGIIILSVLFFVMLMSVCIAYSPMLEEDEPDGGACIITVTTEISYYEYVCATGGATIYEYPTSYYADHVMKGGHPHTGTIPLVSLSPGSIRYSNGTKYIGGVLYYAYVYPGSYATYSGAINCNGSIVEI